MSSSPAIVLQPPPESKGGGRKRGPHAQSGRRQKKVTSREKTTPFLLRCFWSLNTRRPISDYKKSSENLPREEVTLKQLPCRQNFHTQIYHHVIVTHPGTVLR